MPWPLRFLTERGPFPTATPGTCWYFRDWDAQADDPESLRAQFLRNEASAQYLASGIQYRPPILIHLPPGVDFSPDTMRDLSDPNRDGYQIRGSIVDGTLAINPAVVIPNTMYIFWIRNGEVSDPLQPV